LPNYWPLSEIDPAPGDPGALRGYAADLLRRAEGLRQVAALTDRNAADSGSTWIGLSGESFRATSAKSSAIARSLASKLEHAGQAVNTFADDLQRTQGELKRWRDTARIATQDRLKAETELSSGSGEPVRRVELQHIVNEANGKLGAARRDFAGSTSRFSDALRRCVAALEAIGPAAGDVVRRGNPSGLAIPKPTSKHVSVADETSLAGALYPNGTPTAADVKQGAVGDCWLLSALAAMAGSDDGRKKIMNMIHVNDNGTYTITFADLTAVTITGELYVDVDNKPVYAQAAGGQNDNWVQIIEKAYAARNAKGFPSLDGGDQDDALRILGGYKTTTLDLNPSFSFDPSDAEIVRAIRKALDAGKPVTASGPIKGGPHAWTITDVRDGFVHVRNPWGDGQDEKAFIDMLKGPLHFVGPYSTYKTDDPGTLRVPVKEFTNGFDNLEYAT
jgi:uncharacterized protein YukE